MTPKEQAQELVDKFYQTTPNEAWYCPPVGSITSSNYSAWEQAKKCALIAVRELKSNLCPYCIPDSTYYEQVESEIEKL